MKYTQQGQPKRKKYTAMLSTLAAVAVIGVVVVVLVGRGAREAVRSAAPPDEGTTAVRVQPISPTGNNVKLSYVGAVEPKELYSATYPGISTIEKVYVELGQNVVKGERLAVVDTENARDQVETSANALASAQSAQSTAQKNYDRAAADYNDAATIDKRIKDLEDNQIPAAKAEMDAANTTAVQDAKTEMDAAKTAWDLSKTDGSSQATQDSLEADYIAKKSAYETIAADYIQKKAVYDKKTEDLNTLKVRKNTMETIAQAGGNLDTMTYYRAQLDTASSALTEANSALATAQTNYDSAVKALNDCTLKSEIDGYVITITGSDGGVATPINPVVVVGSKENVAAFGASASDVRDLASGQSCLTNVGGELLPGSIIEVGMIPDSDSRTYEVKVSLPVRNTKYLMGEIVSVSIDVGQRFGVWIPIVVILNDGEDYVFTVENGRAVKKTVVISEIANDMALVTGLEGGGQLVVEGMKSLKAGNPVTVVE